MGILSWLKSVTQGGDEISDVITLRPVEFAAGEEEFSGLNMKEALDAHIAWTRRLEDQLKGRDAAHYPADAAAADHLCTLGKWIHGAARREFGALPEYGELLRVHAEFHAVVGAVLSEVQHREQVDAEQALKAVRQKSGDVQLALIRLYASVQGHTTH